MKFHCKNRKIFQVRFQHHPYGKLSHEPSVWRTTTVQCNKDKVLILLEVGPGQGQEVHGIISGSYTHL